MNYSSELFDSTSRVSVLIGYRSFEVIVAFSYYDGPENGLALHPSGDGVRFSSLGDSKSRFFRAFELIPIEGTWWPQVRALQKGVDIDPAHKILVPSALSDELTQLESDVLKAPSNGQFIGVGSPNFEKIMMCAVTEDELRELRGSSRSPAGFYSAHQLVKARKPAANRVELMGSGSLPGR